MTSPLWQSRHPSKQATDSPVNYDDFDDYEDVPAILVAGDRIGAGVPDRSGWRVLRACVMLLVMLGGGWALVDHTVTWPAVLAKLNAVNQPPAPPAEQAAAGAPPAPLQPLPAMEVAATPGTEVGAVATPPSLVVEPSAPGSGQSSSVAAVEPLRPAIPDPADPKQVKAAAVGLHPDVSRALLTRLTESDYRNAGVAIKMALSQTPDSDVLQWPRDAKRDAAVFQVRFVAGASGDCRRYVVEITKDKWVTTAPAMEKCGLPAVKARG
jgi:hypothetical protein